MGIIPMARHHYRAVAVLTATLALIGCSSLSNSVHVSVVFDHADGLTSGTAVQYGGTTIGKVKAVTHGADGATVQLQLEESSRVQRNAAAMITNDGSPRVEILNPGSTGEAIADGDKLYGLNSHLELLAWRAGSTLGAMTEAMGEAAWTAQDYFQSEEWEQAKREMQTQVDILARQSSDALERIGKDYDVLLRELESQSQKAMDQALKDYETLTDELEVQLRQFSEDGQEELSDALQRLLDILNSAIQGSEEYQTI